jgi:hypothetical protein
MSAAPRIPVMVAVLLSSTVASAKPPAPAVARKDDVVDHLHGVDVADPYRWLEDADADEVKQWTDAQNADTRRVLDRVPGRARLEKRFWQLYEIGSIGVPVSRPYIKMGTLKGSPSPPATDVGGQSPPSAHAIPRA